MKKKITKWEAIEKCRENGITFGADMCVYQLSISDKTFLAELAKECGYRKSASSCLSTGSAFYNHLFKMIYPK